jgi:hypothetical protein
MKYHDELKAEVEQLEAQVADALNKVKERYKEFGFTAGILKGVLDEGCKKKDG